MMQEDFWFYKTAPRPSAADHAFFSSKFVFDQKWTATFFFSPEVSHIAFHALAPIVHACSGMLW
jgi:hypothetical protein